MKNVSYEIQVSFDKQVVWVHLCKDGMAETVGRFSKQRGIDIHRTISDMENNGSQCLFCTHSKPTKEDWFLFCDKMKEIYGVEVSKRLIKFND